MGAKKHRRRTKALSIGLLCTLVLGGCDDPDISGEGTLLGMLTLPGVDQRSRVTEDEQNDSFDTPTTFTLELGRISSIDGTIHSVDDIDIYDIGPVAAGDRLVVDISADARLDAAAAVFDEGIGALYVNDDRNYFAHLVDPYINMMARRSTSRAFVVVSSSPTGPSVGDYTLNVTLTPGVDVPAPRPQAVLLNFDGAGGIGFGGRLPVDVPVFDAGVIAESLSGQTDALIDEVYARVIEDYDGLDVVFYTDRGAIPEGAGVTTIHFGTYDPGLLGVAENVDEFNERAEQDAIVFTDTFSVFNVLNPSLEEYAQAIANVTSHEVGHLLGLVHTEDRRGIMDITASLRELMANQAFGKSPIERTTFAIGYQDAATSLLDAVGGDGEIVRRNSLPPLPKSEGRSMRAAFEATPRPPFSLCVCDACATKRFKLGVMGD